MHLIHFFKSKKAIQFNYASQNYPHCLIDCYGGNAVCFEPISDIINKVVSGESDFVCQQARRYHLK